MTPETHPVRDPASWSVPELLDAKVRSGRTVSVVVPARDEEETVGEVVSVVRSAWVEGQPLVDELVVIDSDSVDATGVRAAQAGAVVHRAGEIRADLGPAQGKGEALWKSLFVTSGDVLAFLDADLLEWGPHFVPALLGPLLLDPAVELVKAVYHRPLLDADGQEAESGGRVTELVARPLIALHAPQLAHIVQPLSGEWAIRRSTFAAMSVPVGYGVEIAALWDTAAAFGAEAIAQVNLGRRAHRHHRHDTLGPMAVQVMAAIERRLGGPGAGAPVVPLRQFDPSPEGFVPCERRVDVMERPPAASVGEA